MFYKRELKEETHDYLFFLKGIHNREIYNFDQYTVKILTNIDNKTLSININNIEKEDSVKLILTDFDEKKILNAIDYRNDGYLLNFKSLPYGEYYLKLYINNKEKKMENR